MESTVKNEWKEAAILVDCCAGTIQCGCTLTDEESEWAPTLYLRCKMLMLAIEEKRPDLKW